MPKSHTQKKAKKTLSFFQKAYAIKPPYKILFDAEMLALIAAQRVPWRLQLDNQFRGKKYIPMTTNETVRYLETFKDRFVEALALSKNMQRVRTPNSGSNKKKPNSKGKESRKGNGKEKNVRNQKEKQNNDQTEQKREHNHNTTKSNQNEENTQKDHTFENNNQEEEMNIQEDVQNEKVIEEEEENIEEGEEDQENDEEEEIDQENDKEEGEDTTNPTVEGTSSNTNQSASTTRRRPRKPRKKRKSPLDLMYESIILALGGNNEKGYIVASNDSSLRIQIQRRYNNVPLLRMDKTLIHFETPTNRAKAVAKYNQKSKFLAQSMLTPWERKMLEEIQKEKEKEGLSEDQSSTHMEEEKPEQSV